MVGPEVERVVQKPAKDVEAAVHALYRGEVRQATVQARTGNLVREACGALAAALAGGHAGARPSGGAPSPRPSVAAPVMIGAAVGWSKDEGEAVMKCINAWLPMGSPRDAQPDSKCVAAARELVPTWAQRERAREAVRRLSAP